MKDDLLAAGPVEWFLILSSVLFARIVPRKMVNANVFAAFWIGDRLFNRSGLRHYMDRFYSLPAEEIDVKFAEKRMERFA